MENVRVQERFTAGHDEIRSKKAALAHLGRRGMVKSSRTYVREDGDTKAVQQLRATAERVRGGEQEAEQRAEQRLLTKGMTNAFGRARN